jgi:hypothetical protein
MSSGTLYRVALIRIDVSENIASIIRVYQDDRTPQLCYRGVTTDEPVRSGILCMLEENCSLGFFRIYH